MASPQWNEEHEIFGETVRWFAAEEADADATVNVREAGAREAIRAAAGGAAPDIVIEYVGRKAFVELAKASVVGGGRVVVGGVGTEFPALGPLVSFVGREIGVQGHTRSELGRVVDVVATGRLGPSGSIPGRDPLRRAAEAIEELASRRNAAVRFALLSGASS